VLNRDDIADLLLVTKVFEISRVEASDRGDLGDLRINQLTYY
jgi:hypothetical protein